MLEGKDRTKIIPTRISPINWNLPPPPPLFFPLPTATWAAPPHFDVPKHLFFFLLIHNHLVPCGSVVKLTLYFTYSQLFFPFKRIEGNCPLLILFFHRQITNLI